MSINNPILAESKNYSLSNLLQNFRLWFRYIVKRWWLFALAGLITGTIGFFIALHDKPTYQSKLTFALEDGEDGMGGAISLAAEFGFSIGSSKNVFEGDNILTLLTSRRIVERVLLSVDTLNGTAITMAEYYKKINKEANPKVDSNKKLTPAETRLSNVSFPIGQPRKEFSYLQDSVLKNLYKDFATGGKLKVSKPDKKLNLYEVSVTTYNERFSKVFTDKLIKEATDFYIEIKTKKSKETLDILEERVAQTRGSLNNAISSKAVVQDANVNPAFQKAQATLQTKQVDISTYGAAYGEMYKNLELARYQYLKDKPFLQIIDAADYPMNRIKKGKLKTAVGFAFVGTFFLLIVLTIAHIIYAELKKEKSQSAAILL